MEEFKYDTYCGLYCGACDIMAAFKKSTVENTKPQWEDLPVEFRKNIPAGKAADIICYGCKSDTVFIGCSKCLIRKCAKKKMEGQPSIGKRRILLFAMNVSDPYAR